ncbi:MAG TPA: hypothetical protein DDW42_00415 [Desulfobacteraceae bacterium]|nr:hypothetical protein [Desulfobacteraceae bacterium]
MIKKKLVSIPHSNLWGSNSCWVFQHACRRTHCIKAIGKIKPFITKGLIKILEVHSKVERNDLLQGIDFVKEQIII